MMMMMVMMMMGDHVDVMIMNVFSCCLQSCSAIAEFRRPASGLQARRPSHPRRGSAPRWSPGSPDFRAARLRTLPNGRRLPPNCCRLPRLLRRGELLHVLLHLRSVSSPVLLHLKPQRLLPRPPSPPAAASPPPRIAPCLSAGLIEQGHREHPACNDKDVVLATLEPLRRR